MSQSFSPDQPTVLTLIGKICFRLLGAGLISVVAVPATLFLGFLSGSGRNILLMGSFVVLFSFGWTLLPALRYGRAAAAIALITWIALGTYLAFYGQPHVRGWMVGPWLFATIGNGLLLLRRKSEIRSKSEVDISY